MTKTELRRLFFGFEVHAPWPSTWPKGRLIEEEHRHLTMAFLGAVSLTDIKKILNEFPSPSFNIGPCGWFDRSLFIPKKHPRLIAWHANWFNDNVHLFQEKLSCWLLEKGFVLDERKWLSHVTICRDPSDLKEWTSLFHPTALYLGSFHLYKSLGHSKYESLWSFPLCKPFVEIEHVADIAFTIYGKTIDELYKHALIALSFKDPILLNNQKFPTGIANVEELVMMLNELVRIADETIGCSFKAVSFHGEIQPFQNDLLQWEMIVDV